LISSATFVGHVIVHGGFSGGVVDRGLVTPPALASASGRWRRTRRQLIPSMGRTMRDLLMELVRGGRRTPLAVAGSTTSRPLSMFMTAAKGELARCSGVNSRPSSETRELGVDPEVVQDDAVEQSAVSSR